MAGRFALSAIGVDRPGIVAAVSGALTGLGCNLEDSTMTILEGHFAILLVVVAPEGVRAADLEAALEPAARAMGLVVAVRELAEAATPPGEPGRAATISVHGADRPGIVHAVAQAIAELGANVVDLSTHVVGAEASPGYVMVLRVALPEGLDPERLEAAVRRAAEGVGVHASMRLDDPDVL